MVCLQIDVRSDYIVGRSRELTLSVFGGLARLNGRKEQTPETQNMTHCMKARNHTSSRTHGRWPATIPLTLLFSLLWSHSCDNSIIQPPNSLLRSWRLLRRSRPRAWRDIPKRGPSTNDYTTAKMESNPLQISVSRETPIESVGDKSRMRLKQEAATNLAK